ncbi:MAG: class I SAM-dependent RNA methyltransferase [Pseudomonadota bacterium]
MSKILIEKLVHQGKGVGDLDGKKIFVPFAAPKDELEIKITCDHGTFAEAEILEVIKPGPGRIQPKCPVFGRCGGCQWQHLDYATQLKWKRKILIEALARIGKLGLAQDLEKIVEPTLASPKQWHYRNRIQLHVNSQGRVGFYRPGSKEVVEFEQCFIADPELNRRLNQERTEIAKRSKGIALRLQEGPSFLQVNTLQNEHLKKTLLNWIKQIPHEQVLELYAGSGNFTFDIAGIANQVIASDIDGQAVEIAKQRMLQEKISNLEFVREAAPKTVGRMAGNCDLVVLDPPRKGCAEVVDSIIKLKPKAIIYISCDPATLARDHRNLSDAGFQLKKCLPIDMFPQTFHIESMSLLLSK